MHIRCLMFQADTTRALWTASSLYSRGAVGDWSEESWIGYFRTSANAHAMRGTKDLAQLYYENTLKPSFLCVRGRLNLNAAHRTVHTSVDYVDAKRGSYQGTILVTPCKCLPKRNDDIFDDVTSRPLHVSDGRLSPSTKIFGYILAPTKNDGIVLRIITGCSSRHLNLDIHSDQDRMTSHALPAVFTLPPELLCHIFKLCAPASDAWITNPRWLNFSQVCRLWREVALNDPSLWIRPCLNCSDFTREMVLRAHGLHLNVMLEHIDSPRRHEAAKFLVSRVSFTNSLAIWANEEGLSRFLLATANHGPSYTLERLRLRCDLPDPLSTYPPSHRPVEPGCLLELDALLAATPSIRELELQCCTPNLAVPSQRLHQIASLTLDNSFAPYAQRPKVDIAALLKATPALTRLRINLALSPIVTRYSTQTISAPTSGDPPYIELPRLVSLDLSDDLCLMTDVLSILHAPSLRRLEARNTDYCAPSLAALEALVSWSASWLHPSDNAPLHDISVNMPDDPSETSAQRTALHISVAERGLALCLRLKSTQVQGFFDDMRRHRLLPPSNDLDAVVPSKSLFTNEDSTHADW